MLRTPHPKLESANSSLFTAAYQHPWAETLLEIWMTKIVMVVVSVPAPVGRKIAAEARTMITFLEKHLCCIEAVESYMRREKQRCIAAALKAMELL